MADYVPFYFCPRSVMLNVIYNKNRNPDSDSSLSYTGGQEPVVHLESDLYEMVDWANDNQRRWAFSTLNASANDARFYCDLAKLDEINWDAVAANAWNPSKIKAAKQAEFLVHGFSPWHLISRIGVMSPRIRQRVAEIIEDAEHQPKIDTIPCWYY